MINIERYNDAFIEVFCVDSTVLNDNFSKDNVDAWDSVHQLNIIALLEESFELMLDPEDIMEFTSYNKGREILKKYEIEL